MSDSEKQEEEENNNNNNNNSDIIQEVDEYESSIQERKRQHNNNNSKNNSNSPWLPQIILQHLGFLLFNDDDNDNDENDNDDEKHRKRRKKRLIKIASTTTAGTALIVLVIYYYRHQRSIKGSKGNNNKRWNTMNLGSTLLAFLYQYQKKQKLQSTSSNSTSSSSQRHRRRPEYYNAKEETPLSFLLQAAKQEGFIQKAYIGNPMIYYQTKDSWKKSMLPPDSPALVNSLLQDLAKSGCSDVIAIPESFWSKLTTPLLTAVPFIYLALVYRMMQNLQGGQDLSSKIVNDAADTNNASQRTTFRDVAGLDSIVTELSDVVSYLANPHRYQTLGASPPRGLLLYGPPGSGKTLLARAIAGESYCDSFVACSGSDFVEMYVGRGAARIRSLFQQAKRDALRKQSQQQRYFAVYDLLNQWYCRLLGKPWTPSITQTTSNNSRPPCAILFIDELDALAKARSLDGSGNDEREQTLNQLLTEMDGFYHHNDNDKYNNNNNNKEDNVTLIVIAASNRADILDPAILRRFDRQLYVPHPNEAGRKAILQVHAKRIPCICRENNSGDTTTNNNITIDWDYLASDDITGNFSGADLRNVINEAALLAARENCRMVHPSHLNHAAKRIRQMKQNLTLRGSGMSSNLNPTMFFGHNANHNINNNDGNPFFSLDDLDNNFS